MEFDDAKENIQPLATGRNVSILQASISHSSQELLEKRRELEAAIHSYNGDDPLEPWYNYISWIEQSCPSGGKESGLMQVLSKCLRCFESEERYYQDRRLIKLFIKFLDSQKDSTECYQQLYNAGIGTMVADFYIAWAYCYDSIGQMRKADEVFRRGIECRAQPLDELKEAHQHFGFSVAQRTMYKDDEDALLSTNRQIEERRLALSSLRGYRGRTGREEIGSIRTGTAIKSITPGTVRHDDIQGSSTSSNARVAILSDENVNPNMITKINEREEDEVETSKEVQSATVVRSIVDKARHEENAREPGPWNKVHDKKNAKKLLRQKRTTHELGFSIHEDKDEEDENSMDITVDSNLIIIPEAERNYEKPFKYPANFVSKNRLQPEWILPITTECEPDPQTLPRYNKCMIYPRPNREFQREELCAYFYFKKRGIKNAFTERYNAIWGNDISVPIRLYPNFARQSKPQILNDLDTFFVPPKEKGIMVPFEKIYNIEKQEEFQNEELMSYQLASVGNETVMAIEDMEETMCTSSNNEQVQRRKSFFPMRRSLAIRSILGGRRESSSNEATEPQKTLTPVVETEVAHAPTVSKAKIHVEIKNENVVLPSISEMKTSTEKLEGQVLVKRALCAENEPQVKEEVVFPTHSKSVVPEFQFKTPALPTKSSKSPEMQKTDAPSQVQPLNMLPFEIYVEENTETATPGIFDAEETCSTQVFNNFLKSQSASTPKVTQKMQKRQFGVLLDVPLTTNPTSLETAPPVEATIECADVASAVKELSTVPVSNSPRSPDLEIDVITNAYSLVRKQLSTILETSEQGTTQNTHSTGASTKSTNGSPESDFADTAVTVSGNTMLPNVTHTYNAMKEASCQSTKHVEEAMRNVHITATNTMPERSVVSSIQEYQNDLPANVNVSPIATNKFSIYVDETEILPELPKATLVNVAAGNFDRLIQRDDTATSLQATVRFQDDKTETITNLVPPIFSDGRTETIPKIHDSLFTFEQQAPNTTAKLGPTTALTFLETSQQRAKTTSMSKQASANPTLPTTSMEHLHLEDNDDDSFEFFRKSPPQELKKSVWPTPMKSANTKRHCAQQTPNTIAFKKSSTETSNFKMDFQKFFENDMMNVDDDGNKHAAEYANESAKNKEKTTGNSFFADFSLMGQTPAKNKQEIVKSANMFIGNTQTDEIPSKLETTKQGNTNENKIKNNSILPEYSFLGETQPLAPTNKSTQHSFLRSHISSSSFSFIKETQQLNTEATSKPQENNQINLNTSKDAKTSAQRSFLGFQNISSTNKKLQDSFLPNFSYIEETQPTNEMPLKSLKENPQKTPLLEKLCPQSHEKRTSTSHIPKRVTTTKSLVESKIPESSPPKLRQTEFLNLDLPSNVSTNMSFIPETQELQSNSCETSQIKHTKLDMLPQKTVLPITKNDSSCSISISKDMSHLTAIAKESNPQCLTSSAVFSNEISKILEKSKVNNASNNPTSKSNCAPIFELNAETEMFSTGLDMIKNSTMLSRSSIKPSQPSTSSSHTQLEAEQEMSIYFKYTPRTPVLKVHNKSWSDSEDNEAEYGYLHHEINLNETNQRIHSICEDQHVNPFNADLLNALLDQIDFVNYLKDLKNTMFIGKVPRLSINSILTINDMKFSITKLIAEGAYGTIYRGVENKSRKEYAFKQERPPNYWEYYICLEVQTRITNEEILPAYMNIDYALIGNNASIFLSSFSPYGSIISVCNKIKKNTLKNVDEYVVMHLTCELLEIIDHLHATQIIHADVKADNFLLMKKLIYNSRQLSLQLIDFGVSIDMKHFKKNQSFTYVHNDNAFKCVEMRENRPWTYQLDLYGLAGVIHVLLFGKYMEIEKRSDKVMWLPKTHMPRYINKQLWELIFQTLLNVRDCRSMPNLQQLRSMIKEEMVEKERYVISKIAEFNKALEE